MSATVEEARDIQVLLSGRNPTWSPLFTDISADNSAPADEAGVTTTLASGKAALEVVWLMHLKSGTNMTLRPYIRLNGIWAIAGDDIVATESWSQIMRCGPGDRVYMRVVSTDGVVDGYAGLPDVS